MTVKARIVYEPVNDSISLGVMYQDFGKRYHLPTSTWKEHDYAIPITPLIKQEDGPETREILQAILDASWEFGLRPTGFGDIKNETAALRDHIADFRNITTKLLDKVCKK